MSYRKKILEAVRDIGTKQGRVKDISIKNIAKHAGITEKIVQSEFKDLDEIYEYAAVERFKEHEAKSKNISKLPGEYALGTLIRHDLSLVYLYTRYTVQLADQSAGKHALELGLNYIDTIMPNFYYLILKNNPDMMPNKGMNARLYAQFIVHSMFFFTKKELYTLNPNVEELKIITRQIISSVFCNATKIPKQQVPMP
jgi:hypothetical protein